MNVPDWQEIVLSLVSLAREQLSTARLFRQEAQVAQDIKDEFGVRPTDPELIPTLLKSAQEMRIAAGVTLELIEIENGKMVMLGIIPLRLDVWLNGHMFREWREYHEVYKDNQHLKEGLIVNPH